jgi:hypothetical protein
MWMLRNERADADNTIKQYIWAHGYRFRFKGADEALQTIAHMHDPDDGWLGIFNLTSIQYRETIFVMGPKKD